ncbi:regulator of chromosome condensation [Anaeramoeba flamelloides]|uniref:Regulator of chromosome condensation n=1 Tax=Anaeramoeba flamelloides TaxID=1746091 RepID=A0ABQ8Z5U5_9EUKA|nr:regulator of chromosome condensation [Anaeramoeba flamelloides]
MTTYVFGGISTSRPTNKKHYSTIPSIRLTTDHNIRSFPGINRVTQIVSGRFQTLTLDARGKIRLFSADTGQLGEMIPNIEKEKIKKLYCGFTHFFMETISGRLFVFGDNSFGKAGFNMSKKRIKTPTEITFFKERGLKIKSIFASCQMSIFLCQNGRLFTTGLSPFSHRGDLTTEEVKCEPHLELNKVSRAFLGYGSHHFFYIRKGKLFGIGKNEVGQLGLSKSICEERITSPNEIKTFNEEEIARIKKICMGLLHSVLLLDKKVWSCGHKECSGLGKSVSIFTKISKLKNVNILKISTGMRHTIALSEENVFYGWGDSVCGQLGIQKNDWIKLPKKFKKPKLEKNEIWTIYSGYFNSFVFKPTYSTLQDDLIQLLKFQTYGSEKIGKYKVDPILLENRLGLKFEQISKRCTSFSDPEIFNLLLWCYGMTRQYNTENLIHNSTTSNNKNDKKKRRKSHSSQCENSKRSCFEKEFKPLNIKQLEKSLNALQIENQYKEKPFSKIIDDLYENQESKDFTIKIKNEKEIKIHKFILQARSTYFRQLFNSQSWIRSWNDPKVSSIPALNILIEFLYFDQIDISNFCKDLETALGLAEHYQIDGINSFKRKIKEFKKKNLEYSAFSNLSLSIKTEDLMFKK